MSRTLRRIVTLGLQRNTYTWENVFEPVEDAQDRLDRICAPVRHLNVVLNTEDMRASYNACLPKISAYQTELGQNASLYGALNTLAQCPEYSRLETAQRWAANNALLDFHLSGVDLPAVKKERVKAHRRELTQLQAKFNENALDATHAWTLFIDDPRRLTGLPESTLDSLYYNACARAMEGWLLTLDLPSYTAVMSYADDRSLREKLYVAYKTRAFEQGPHAGSWHNTPILTGIRAIRSEFATVQRYSSFAEFSL